MLTTGKILGGLINGKSWQVVTVTASSTTVAIQQDCFLSDLKNIDDSHENDACFRVNDIFVTLFNYIREASFKNRINNRIKMYFIKLEIILN